MKRILFVDDEPNVLQGLQRMLRSMRDEWEPAFVGSGQEALELLERQPFDVIVTDMRMPGMSGAQLLNEVMQRRPQIVRIILSGQSDKEAILRSVGPAHQYLAKPCDADTLKNTVIRVCALHDLLEGDALQRVVLKIKCLPSLPALYTEMAQALQSSEASMREIGELVAKDMAMTSKLLQLVNSAFFGFSRRVTDPVQAVTLIGIDTLRSLVLSLHIFSQFEEKPDSPLCLQTLWRHSMATANFARQIARAQEMERSLVEDAFAAGLLHDVGKLLLTAEMPLQAATALKRAREGNISLGAAEREISGATHAEVGAYLMGLWGLPMPIVEALAFHHRPMEAQSPTFAPLTAVYMADFFEHEFYSENVVGPPDALDTEYLLGLGLADCVPTWREACRKADSGDDR